jgi:eukaryotic-like serine/threonine-protein kinase
VATADRIIEVLHEAKLRPRGPERDRFVDIACADDAAVKEQVISLLKAHVDGRDGDFLGDIPVIRPALPLTEKPGDRIGRYKLLEQIGEGGCGVVYMADQEEPVRRRVAVKVIKLGMDTKEVIARFEAERQALALMDHPNIAKVLDGGATETGRPYFVMELVRGIKITDYCDQNQLSTTQRIELFIQVCQAVQHAHQKGIIHRDLKPSNILVTQHDDVAVPKIIDFGIAKATSGQLTDRTLFTAFAQFVGTPAYMSPEQAQMSGLDVDTRADIYSLGVLLYELLTGKTPFDAKALLAAGVDEMRRKIREDEPARPSTCLSTMQAMNLTTVAKCRQIDSPKLIHLISGDLDCLVMKCLEKDRARRYETANALATDLQRHLNDEPVLARPPSRSYRFQKMVRRNKLAFAAGTAIAASLVIGLTTATWMYFRETDARKRATKAEKLAGERLIESEHARAAAEASESRALAAEKTANANAGTERSARAEAEAILKFMGELFQSPDPTRDGRSITVAETLDAAVKRLETELNDQPERRAKLQSTLSRIYFSLGLHRQAVPLREDALKYYAASSTPDDPATIRALDLLADSYYAVGRRSEALKMREEVLAFRRKVFGPDHPDTLRAMRALAQSYYTAERKNEALEMREEVLALRREVNGPEHPDTLEAMRNLSQSYFAVGRRDEALKMREEVLALRRAILGPERSDTIRAMQDVAGSYFDANRKDEALKMREEVLALRRKGLGPEHPETLTAIHHLADSFLHAARGEEALKMREELLALRRKVLGSEHPETLETMNNLVTDYRAKGRVAEAEALEKEIAAAKAKVKPAGK